MQLKQKLIIPRPELTYKIFSKVSVDILNSEKEIYVKQDMIKITITYNVIIGFI